VDVKKVLAFVLISLVVAVAFVGCNRQAAKKQIIIGFNNGSTTVDFLRQVGESMKRAADKAGVKLLVAESNFDAEKILPNVDNLMLQGGRSSSTSTSTRRSAAASWTTAAPRA
jgi:ABC-type sugar transport system substrate-binding protein